jgi:hypothetical protein
MLDRVVRIKEARPDGAHLRSLDVLGHGREPIAIDDFGIVIQKEQPRTVRLLDGKIVDRGEVEPAAVVQDAMLESRQVGARFFGLAVVVHDHDLVGRVGGQARDAIEAARQQVHAIANRNDDRDRLRFRQVAFYPVGVSPPIHSHVAASGLPLEMGFEREPPGFE